MHVILDCFGSVVVGHIPYSTVLFLSWQISAISLLFIAIQMSIFQLLSCMNMMNSMNVWFGGAGRDVGGWQCRTTLMYQFLRFFVMHKNKL